VLWSCALVAVPLGAGLAVDAVFGWWSGLGAFLVAAVITGVAAYRTDPRRHCGWTSSGQPPALGEAEVFTEYPPIIIVALVALVVVLLGVAVEGARTLAIIAVAATRAAVRALGVMLLLAALSALLFYVAFLQ
jgi:hypothetical protein